MSSSITAWFAKLPRNTTDSIQRLTPYGWLRLILVVALYLLIRPYLMRLAVRGQNRAHDQVLNMRGPPGEEEVVREDEETGGGRSSGRDEGSSRENTIGRRGKGKRAVGVEEEELAKGVAMEDVDEDVEFLKRYCVERGEQ
ncbi:MAG: hypothetical protein Q9184_006553 [Pyrenodesmia sp. 2 TL-2023]